MKSSRLTPNQFAVGLDVSATRMEADLVALANRLNAPLPTDIARRWVETHMVAGMIPNLLDVTTGVDIGATDPQSLPWMGAYNPAPFGTFTADTAAGAIAPPVTPIVNPWRAKATAQPAIDPTMHASGTILSWETAWAQTPPCLLDAIQITLATDSVYANNFLWGAGHPEGKTPGAPVDNIVVQVLVDSALASENRGAATLPLLVRSFAADTYVMDALNSPPETMVPAASATSTVPVGLCIRVFPREPIPANARVRVILSIPLYADHTACGFGRAPWQTFVLSSHVTLLEPALAASAVGLPQFTVKAFPRGVKLAVQNVWTPAQTMQMALQNTAIVGQTLLAPFKMSWTFTPDSETFGCNPAGKSPQQYPQVPLPMIFPPPQGVFDAATKQYTSQPQLVALSVGFDQRAQPNGIVDSWAVWPQQFGVPGDAQTQNAQFLLPGMMTDADLTRYDTTLTLIQKIPTVFGQNGDDTGYQEILTLTLPGASLFGAADLNPFALDGLAQYLNPYGVYYWLVSTPGLAALSGPTAVQSSSLIVTGTPVGGETAEYHCTLIPVFWGPGCTFTLTPSSGGGPYFYTTGGYFSTEYVDALAYFVSVGNADSASVWDYSILPGDSRVLVCKHKVAGATSDSVAAASSVVGCGTFVSTLAVAGADSNTVGVTDGPNSFVYQIRTGDTLADCAAGLADLINLNNGYTAKATGQAVIVSNLPGVAFKFSDISTSLFDPTGRCYVWWGLSAPLLAMPNFNLTCTFAYPLEPRDYSVNRTPTANPYVQNIPTKHLGQPQHGAFTLIGRPAADAVITGDDVQAVVTELEGPILDRLRAGYGRDPGSEADTFPWEQLANDAGYQVINVQMFPNWWDVRSNRMAVGLTLPNGVGFPYCDNSTAVTDTWDNVVSGAVTVGDLMTQTIGSNVYHYSAHLGDTDNSMAYKLVGVINAGAGDPLYIASIVVLGTVHLEARYAGVTGVVPHATSSGTVAISNGHTLTGVAYTTAVVDQRIISVPTGFVLHHVIVCQNTFPYPDNRIYPQGARWGVYDTAGFVQNVGVALYNGLRSDDQREQQLAQLQWTGSQLFNGGTDRKYLIDELQLDGAHTNYLLLNCPLVAPTTANGAASYGGTPVGTGKPCWMGAGNSTTSARTEIGQQPANFGAGADVLPVTSGAENLLLLRWSIANSAGLAQGGSPQVLTGPGGHQIILIGKQSTVGADTDGKVVSGNAIVGGW